MYATLLVYLLAPWLISRRQRNITFRTQGASAGGGKANKSGTIIQPPRNCLFIKHQARQASSGWFNFSSPATSASRPRSSYASYLVFNLISVRITVHGGVSALGPGRRSWRNDIWKGTVVVV